MTHRRARRNLSALLDRQLSPCEEAAVREHLEACRRCRATLGELEAAERLLRRIPATLIPLEWSPAGEARLRGLARWAPVARREPAWRLPALGALAGAAAVALAMWIQPQAPTLETGGGSPSRVVVAAHMPSSFLVPTLEATASVPYTWRQ